MCSAECDLLAKVDTWWLALSTAAPPATPLSAKVTAALKTSRALSARLRVLADAAEGGQRSRLLSLELLVSLNPNRSPNPDPDPNPNPNPNPNPDPDPNPNPNQGRHLQLQLLQRPAEAVERLEEVKACVDEMTSKTSKGAAKLPLTLNLTLTLTV